MAGNWGNLMEGASWFTGKVLRLDMGVDNGVLALYSFIIYEFIRYTNYIMNYTFRILKSYWFCVVFYICVLFSKKSISFLILKKKIKKKSGLRGRDT